MYMGLIDVSLFFLSFFVLAIGAFRGTITSTRIVCWSRGSHVGGSLSNLKFVYCQMSYSQIEKVYRRSNATFIIMKCGGVFEVN